MLKPEILKQLINWRHELHQHPELSGNEKHTSAKICQWVKNFHPDNVIQNLGGYGVLVTYNGISAGKHVLIRVDMDALPIQEESETSYKSQQKEVAHVCGHDGHMVIGLSLCHQLYVLRPENGSVSILFQPAEEIGQGAKSVYNDPRFPAKDFDFVIGLHNIPGLQEGRIFVKDGAFACASTGLILHFKGRTSHAAEPENGNSPTLIIRDFMNFIDSLQEELSTKDEYSLITIVHVKIGERNFGIAPGVGTVMLTLRSESDQFLALIINRLVSYAQSKAGPADIAFSHEITEDFPATINSNGFAFWVSECDDQKGNSVITMKEPFRWSEDFGLFTKYYSGGMIGLGAGTDLPDLHNPNYDFPDTIILPASEILEKMIRNALKHEFDILH